MDPFLTWVCLTNRFQVAVCLFSNRSQMMSKCGKNKKVAHEVQLSASLMFLPHLTSSVIYYLSMTRFPPSISSDFKNLPLPIYDLGLREALREAL